MANGFAPYVLNHMSKISAQETPEFKVTPAGWLIHLLNQGRAAVNNLDQVLRGDDGSGHLKDVKFYYRQRITDDMVADSDTCDIENQPVRLEGSIPRTLFRKYGFTIDDATIAQYQNDASQMMKAGAKPTPLMSEFMANLMASMNGLLGSIDKALLTKQAANFGVNQVSGSNAALSVNIPQDNTVNNLATGLTKILTDAVMNEMTGPLTLVGSGNITAYQIQQAFKTANQAGVDTSRITGYKFIHDPYAAAGWGANQVGVFADGVVQLVDINRFVGFRAGEKGGSEFFTIPVPVEIGNGVYSTLLFDAQYKYFDCPTQVNLASEGSGGGTVTVNRQGVLWLSKSFDQWNIPANAYRSTDRLFENNGTLRYTVTNT